MDSITAITRSSLKRIAVVCADGLGDALLSMVFAQNLQDQYAVTTFSNYLVQLADWFPGKNIQPFPPAEKVTQAFTDFDEIISTDGAFLVRKIQFSDPRHIVFYERDFSREKTVLEIFLQICEQKFGIKKVTMDNGLRAPSTYQAKKYPQRVIIHPTSTSDSKNWPVQKFIRLANKLCRHGFEPVFIVSSSERSHWQTILPHKFALPEFAHLSAVAGFIRESGFMIGNDSGIGHLAANVGVPTLSLFSRRRVANLWRPNWGKNKVVLAAWQLPGSRLRIKYWKKFLTVGKVWRSFKKLVAENALT